MADIRRLIVAGAIFGCAVSLSSSALAQSASVRVERLFDRPIITSQLDPSLGPNIQGPSLIRVPDWVSGRLGKYYLYFPIIKLGTVVSLTPKTFWALGKSTCRAVFNSKARIY